MKLLSYLPIAGLFVAAAGNAQAPAPRSDSGCTTGPNGRTECTFFRMRGGDDSAFRRMHARMDSMMAKRAALGLELRPTGSKRDSLGVFVENVAPGGPAETAGIVEGDRIASINGVDLRTTGADAEDPYTNGLASHRLSREVQKLTPGARVNLRVWSGGRYREVQVTAGKAMDLMHERMNFGADGPMMMHFRTPGGMGMPMEMEDMEMMGPMMEHMKMMAPNGPGGARIRITTPDANHRKIELREPAGAGTMTPAPRVLNRRVAPRRAPLIRA